jgi:sortase A
MTTASLDLDFFPVRKQGAPAAPCLLQSRPQSRQVQPRWGLVTVALLCLGLGGALMFDAALIHFKAWLGPILLRHAWAETLATGAPVKPWSWADITPAGWLQIPGAGIDLIALNDSSGEALAWGPGLWSPPGDEGGQGLTILTGHRDTHFAFLKNLQKGENLTFTNAAGLQHHYVIETTQIVDVRTDHLVKPDDSGWLLLITCYPFDGIAPHPPERFVIWAKRQAP